MVSMKPSSTLSFRLHALVYSIDSLACRVVNAHADISFPQFLVILCAFENPGRTQKFAAEWLQITEATISYMVKRLVHANYLEVKKGKADGRTKKVYATEKGRLLIDELYPVLEKKLEPHFDKLNTKKRKVMQEGIETIHESIKKLNEVSYEGEK
jgi:DNA-binding MarR family transcriptional regulator